MCSVVFVLSFDEKCNLYTYRGTWMCNKISRGAASCGMDFLDLGMQTGSFMWYAWLRTWGRHEVVNKVNYSSTYPASWGCHEWGWKLVWGLCDHHLCYVGRYPSKQFVCILVLTCKKEAEIFHATLAWLYLWPVSICFGVKCWNDAQLAVVVDSWLIFPSCKKIIMFFVEHELHGHQIMVKYFSPKDGKCCHITNNL